MKCVVIKKPLKFQSLRQVLSRKLTLLSLLACSSWAQSDISYQELPFSLPGAADNLWLADLDNDGLQDILCVDGRHLDVYFQNRIAGQDNNSPAQDEGIKAFDFSAPQISLELPGYALGWDLEEDEASEGALAGHAPKVVTLFALIDGSSIQSWHFSGRKLSAAKTEVTGLKGFLPRGVKPVNFVRNIDGDNKVDFVVPAGEEILIYLSGRDASDRSTPEPGSEQSYAKPVSIKSAINIRSNLHAADRKLQQIGQTIRVPQVKLKDFNNDGAKDLMTSDEESIDVYLALATRSGNGGFSQQPSISVDLKAIEGRIGKPDAGNLDLKNLAASLNYTHTERFVDFTQDGIEDLVIREGQKYSFYIGNANGMDLTKPDQIIKTEGNPLPFILFFDEDGDGLKDFWLTQVESISVGNLIWGFLFSLSLDIDAFVYRNQGQGFSRLPKRQVTLSLKLPSGRHILSEGKKITRQMEIMQEETPPEQWLISRDATLDSGANKDMVVLSSAGIAGYLNLEDSISVEEEDTDALEQEEPLAIILRVLGFDKESDRYKLDVKKILDDFTIPSQLREQQIADREAAFTLALDRELNQDNDFDLADINGDGVDDILVFYQRDNAGLTGALLISKEQSK